MLVEDSHFAVIGCPSQSQCSQVSLLASPPRVQKRKHEDDGKYEDEEDLSKRLELVQHQLKLAAGEAQTLADAHIALLGLQDVATRFGSVIAQAEVKSYLRPSGAISGSVNQSEACAAVNNVMSAAWRGEQPDEVWVLTWPQAPLSHIIKVAYEFREDLQRCMMAWMTSEPSKRPDYEAKITHALNVRNRVVQEVVLKTPDKMMNFLQACICPVGYDDVERRKQQLQCVQGFNLTSEQRSAIVGAWQEYNTKMKDYSRKVSTAHSNIAMLSGVTASTSHFGGLSLQAQQSMATAALNQSLSDFSIRHTIGQYGKLVNAISTALTWRQISLLHLAVRPYVVDFVEMGEMIAAGTL